jgi:hypothetical protein
VTFLKGLISWIVELVNASWESYLILRVIDIKPTGGFPGSLERVDPEVLGVI